MISYFFSGPREGEKAKLSIHMQHPFIIQYFITYHLLVMVTANISIRRYYKYVYAHEIKWNDSAGLPYFRKNDTFIFSSKVYTRMRTFSVYES